MRNLRLLAILLASLVTLATAGCSDSGMSVQPPTDTSYCGPGHCS